MQNNIAHLAKAFAKLAFAKNGQETSYIMQQISDGKPTYSLTKEFYHENSQRIGTISFLGGPEDADLMFGREDGNYIFAKIRMGYVEQSGNIEAEGVNERYQSIYDALTQAE